MFNKTSKKPVADRRHVLVGCITLLSILLSACGTPAATQAPGTEAPAATEATVEQVPAGSSVSLQLLYSGTEDDLAFLQKQVEVFQQEHPEIVVEINYVPFDSLMDILATRLAAGDAPDLATLSLNNLVELQRMDALSPPDLGKIELPDDFRSDALSSGKVDGNQYGLAVQQYGCAPAYQYIAQFRASQHPEEGAQFIGFLTSMALQKEAYETVGWVPTRQSVYDELGVNCQPLEPIRLSPADISTSITIVKDRRDELTAVLNGVKLNPYEAVTIIENGVLMGTFAARETPITEEEIKNQMSSGIVVGGMFIENAPEYPKGAYVLKCKADLDCFFLRADGSDPGLKPESVAPLERPIEKLVVVAVRGSTKVTVWVPFVGNVTVRIG